MDFNSGYAPVTSVQNAVEVDWDHYAIDESGPVLDLQCFSARFTHSSIRGKRSGRCGVAMTIKSQRHRSRLPQGRPKSYC